MNGRQAGGNIGFAGALALLFIGLKLAGIIAWPWLWVLCPIWIPPMIIAALLSVLAVMYVGTSLVEYVQQRREPHRGRDGLPRPSEHGPAHRWGPHDPDR